MSFAGEMQNDDDSYQMALGNVNVRTMQRVACFDPDDDDASADNANRQGGRYGKRSCHDSIWNRKFDPRSRDPAPSADEAAARRRKEEGIVQTAFGDMSVNRKPSVKREGTKRKVVQRVEESEEEADGVGEDLAQFACYSQTSSGSNDTSSKKRMRANLEGSELEWGDDILLQESKHEEERNKPKTVSQKDRRQKTASEKLVVHSRYFVKSETLEKMNSQSGKAPNVTSPEKIGQSTSAMPDTVVERESERPGKLDGADGEPQNNATDGQLNKTRKRRKLSEETSHSWLNCLDDQTNVGNKFIYNTDFIQERKSEEETVSALGGQVPKLPTLPKGELRSTQSSRGAFKPVLAKTKADDDVEDEEVKRRRNPFLVSNRRKEEASQSSQDSAYSSCSPPRNTKFSQASIDAESFDLSSQARDQSSQDESRQSQEENKDPNNSASTVTKRVTDDSSTLRGRSSYFSSTPSPKIQTKTRSVSSAAKRKSSSKSVKSSPAIKGQRSVMDLWAKR